MPTADELIGHDTLESLIMTIGRAAPTAILDTVKAARTQLAPLSLRARSDLLKDALLQDLPGDFSELHAILRHALTDDDFRGWLIWPVTEAVAAKALGDGSDEAFDSGLALLADLSPRLTAEFAIRPMLEANLHRAIPQIQAWVTSPDAGIRRLASEGTRPFLPWAKRVHAILAEPQLTIGILDALYRDDNDAVRRSVANHLNDLSRQQADLTVETGRRWLQHPDANTPAVVKHGLRTLIKKGHPGALALRGFAPVDTLAVTGPILDTPNARVGGELSFHVTIENTGAAPVALAVDYIVHHRKANGSQTAKVFKLATRTVAAGEAVTLTRRHSFKKITTRVYYAGQHDIEVQINGVTSGRQAFDLLVPTSTPS